MSTWWPHLHIAFLKCMWLSAWNNAARIPEEDPVLARNVRNNLCAYWWCGCIGISLDSLVGQATTAMIWLYHLVVDWDMFPTYQNNLKIVLKKNGIKLKHSYSAKFLVPTVMNILFKRLCLFSAIHYLAILSQTMIPRTFSWMMSSIVFVMAWCWIGDKSWFNPMMTKINGTFLSFMFFQD